MLETPNGLKPGDIVIHEDANRHIGVIYSWDGECDSLDVYVYLDKAERYDIRPRHWFWSLCTKVGSIYEFEDFAWD